MSSQRLLYRMLRILHKLDFILIVMRLLDAYLSDNTVDIVCCYGYFAYFLGDCEVS